MKKIYILILLFYVSLSPSTGQNTFNLRYDYGKAAAVNTGVIATDSCYYVTGIVVDKDPDLRTGSFFARFDLEGNLVTQKTLESTDQTYETWRPSLQALEDGNFIVSGYSLMPNNMLGIIIKYTPNGGILWLREYDDLYDFDSDFFRVDGLCVTKDNGFIIGGNEENGVNDADAFLIKTDSLGNKEWSKTFFTSNSAERLNQIIPTDDGGYLCAGYRYNYLIPNVSEEDWYGRAFFFKTDSLGNEEWRYAYPTPDSIYMDQIFAMLLNDDGSIVFTSGEGIDEAPWTSSPIVHPTIKLYKFNADIQQMWEVAIDALPEHRTIDRATQLIRLKNEAAYILTGYIFDDASSITGQDDYNQYGLIAKVSDDGELIWQRTLHYVENYTASHELNDIKETVDGGFIMCGSNRKTFLSDLEPDEILTNAWLIKTDEHGCLVPGCHLTDSVELPEDLIVIELYPNPTSDYLNIYYKQNILSNDAHFQIVNMNGQVVDSFQHVQAQTTYVVSVDHLPIGNYILQYMEKGVLQYSKQFAVQR